VPYYLCRKQQRLKVQKETSKLLKTLAIASALCVQESRTRLRDVSVLTNFPNFLTGVLNSQTIVRGWF
jgi:hypothetical protein